MSAEPLPKIDFPADQLSLWIAFMVFLSWVFFTAVVGACMICFPYPKTTLADSLLESKTVVMAKERNDKAYTFYAVEVLKGAIDGIDFNAFIDTATRRKLRMNQMDAVVFRREITDSDWQYITYADFEYQEFIRAILEQSSEWKKFSGDENRIDFFAERLNHSNQRIREQAYLEVGRAPYASIKRIASTVPRHQIREFLEKWRLIEWHNLYILMLGQSRHPDDIVYIRNQLESAAAYGFKSNLSAWVTAFIETNPGTGVDEIENLYFSNKSRTTDELQEVWRGFSVLGSEGSIRGAPELIDRRYRIVQSYGTMLENHPLMAGSVAKDLTIWQIRAFEKRLTHVKENESALEPDVKMAISHYLSISHRFPRIKTVQ